MAKESEFTNGHVDKDSLQRKVRKDKRTQSWRFQSLRDLKLNPAFRIISLNLFQGPSRVLNIGLYYKMCVESHELHVTTSCFTVWKNNKRTNAYAKLIPALPVERRHGEPPVCVFFFDDNIEWGGTEDSTGIVNLRNVETGEFVDFAEGRNGFQRAYVGRHTVLHHSKDFRNVLVKANILDAIEDKDYFVNIIKSYALPDEKILVFMDVNSTIVCYDSAQGKDMDGSLMSSMFELIEARPREPIEFNWEGAKAPVKIDKAISLKSLVKKITNDDKTAYAEFFQEQTCQRLLQELEAVAETRYSSPAGAVNSEAWTAHYRECQVSLATELSASGIVRSWFRVWDYLKQGDKHAVVLNSYGVDTRKVVLETVKDEREVMQITVNYELWSKSDVAVFEEQYREASPMVKEYQKDDAQVDNGCYDGAPALRLDGAIAAKEGFPFSSCCTPCVTSD